MKSQVENLFQPVARLWSIPASLSSRRTVGDFVVYLPTLVVPGLVNILLIPILTRNVSSGDYGKYVLAMGVWQNAPTLVTLWIDSGLIRFVPEHLREGTLGPFVILIGTVEAILITAVTLAGVLVLSLCSNGLASDLATMYQFALFGFPGFAVLLSAQSFLRARRRAMDYTLLSLLRVVGGVAVGMWVGFDLGYGIVGFFAGTIGLTSVLGIWGLARCIQLDAHSPRSAPVNASWDWHCLVDMANYGLPTAAMNLAAQILSVGDRYLIAAFLNDEAVGLYNAGYVVTENTIRLVSMSILAAATPIAFSIWESEGEGCMEAYVGKLIRAYTALGLPLLLGLNFVKGDLFRVLVAPSFANATAIVPLVSSAVFLHGYTMIINLEFYARKRSFVPLLLTMLSAFINVLLNLLLIPSLGNMGAAWATLIAYSALALCTAVLLRERLRLAISWRQLLPVALATATMGVALAGTGLLFNESSWQHGMIFGVVGAGIYLASMIIFNSNFRHQLSALRRFGA